MQTLSPLEYCEYITGTSKWFGVIYKKTYKKLKHHISFPHADMYRSISTKFCMMIEDLRAIIAPA